MAKGIESKTQIRQDNFFKEWLVDFDATRAYAKAYNHKKITMATKTAASRLLMLLLTDVKYIGVMRKRKEKLEEESWLNEKYVVDGLRDMTEKCMQKKPVMEFDYKENELIHKQEFDDKGKLVGVYEFDSRGASKGYELLGKHLKMFSDKIDLTAKIYNTNAVIVIGGKKEESDNE